MRWQPLILGLALVAGACGCRSSCSRVESELAARESDVRVLKDQLAQSEGLSATLFRDLQAARGLPGPHGVVEPLPPRYPVKNIALGGMTGGVPSATFPGDDALQVLIEVRDHEDQPLKVPGHVHVEALEVTPEGLKRPLSAWEVPVEHLRGKWQQGLFNTGYLLTFPWKVWPTTDKVRVVVRFTLLDGRPFEAEKTITVRLLPEASRPKEVPTPAPVLPIPTPAPVLPPPTPSAPVLPPPTPLPMPSEGPTLPPPSPASILKPVPWKAD
jgi:hypothetical protein